MLAKHERCPTCHGRGFTMLYGSTRVTCTRCKGVGIIPISKKCPECDGKGSIIWLEATFTCGKCHGTGKIK